jgi:hypothetical protein
MNRRNFIKRGALLVPAFYIGRSLAQDADSAEGIALFKRPVIGGGSFPSSTDADWRLNGDLTDSSGGGNSLTANGAAMSYGTDEHGTASKSIILNGSDNYLNASASSLLNYTTLAFSILAWVKPTGTISNSPVIFSHGAFASTGYYLQIASNGHVEFQIGRGSAPTSAKVITANSVVSLGNWYGILVVINGSSGKILVNGADATLSSDALSAPSSDSNPFRIGRYSSSANFFTGSIAQVAAWGRSLDSTEQTGVFSVGSQ